MTPALLLAFWGVVFVLIVVPGPDWAYTVACGLRDRGVFPAVAGIVTGYLILTGVVAAGLGVLVMSSPLVLTTITVAGAGYLSYLGGALLVRRGGVGPGERPAAGERAGAGPPVTAWRVALRGIGVSGLNPKGLLIFVAMLPQFTDPGGAWPIPVQLGVLGLVFTATCAVFYTALGLTARAVLRAHPTTSRILSRTCGATMVLVGLLLLAERLVPLLS
jgi:threonine/homoserine/homoserine lactone efflux protein